MIICLTTNTSNGQENIKWILVDEGYITPYRGFFGSEETGKETLKMIKNYKTERDIWKNTVITISEDLKQEQDILNSQISLLESEVTSLNNEIERLNKHYKREVKKVSREKGAKKFFQGLIAGSILFGIIHTLSN